VLLWLMMLLLRIALLSMRGLLLLSMRHARR
jgi:hypothetical protein